MSQSIYHERQVRELCAVHALNNLFQQKMFTKAELDEICERLSPSRWLNPHRSFLGTGNFDINVILTALQDKGYAAIWFDKRKDPGHLNLDKIIGFILNIPSPYDFGVIRFPLNRRHWFTIGRIQGKYYNLDSKLATPLLIGQEQDVVRYLQTELNSNDRQLFVIVDQQVEKGASWISETNCIATTEQAAEQKPVRGSAKACLEQAVDEADETKKEKVEEDSWTK